MSLLIKRALSYFPSKLPVGMSEFNVWSQDIIDLAGPMADDDSMKFAIASQLMHQGSTSDRIPKRFFVAALRKAAANQVAAQVFQDVKLRQAERQAKEAAEALAATTAPESVAQGAE